MLPPLLSKPFVDSGKGFQRVGKGGPDRVQVPHTPYPPFSIRLGEGLRDWGDLRIDGFLAGQQVVSRSYSGTGVDEQFVLFPDDTDLLADGADAKRVVLRVNDKFGRIRPFASDAIAFALEGPGTIVGNNLFALVGGRGDMDQGGRGRWHRAFDRHAPCSGEQDGGLQADGRTAEQA